MEISADIINYNNSQTADDKAICELLAKEIATHLPEAENKVWHGHPVWFVDGNPIAGYSKQKKGLRLMFWSGQGFNEPSLDVIGEKFKDASIFYKSVEEIDIEDLQRWLEKSRDI